MQNLLKGHILEVPKGGDRLGWQAWQRHVFFCVFFTRLHLLSTGAWKHKRKQHGKRHSPLKSVTGIRVNLYQRLDYSNARWWSCPAVNCHIPMAVHAVTDLGGASDILYFFHSTAPAEHWCLKTKKKTTWKAALAAPVCHRHDRHIMIH